MSSKYDLVIVGASHAGGALAAALAAIGIRIALIDNKPLIPINSQEIKDFRTTAIANQSANLLDKMNLWENLSLNAGKIEQIRITDNDSPYFLHFNNKLIRNEILGYIVDNHHLLGLFHRKIQQSNLVTFYSQTVKDISQNDHIVEIELSNNEKISTHLLIAADGRMSPIRQKFNFDTYIKEYHHSAIVGYVEHFKPHRNIAIEKFYSNSGPFASLPLLNPHKSNIIWTEKTAAAQAILKADKNLQQELLAEKFGHFWGEVKLVSNLYAYPLNLVKVNQIFNNRVLLFGDAAHGIHPIAGQGYNLTIRDLDILVKLIKEHISIGGDLGSEILLRKYQDLRKADNLNMIFITDQLNSLFLSNNPLIKASRKIGLGLINHTPLLKRFFMNYAMGKRSND